jgi:hypothetical protein
MELNVSIRRICSDFYESFSFNLQHRPSAVQKLQQAVFSCTAPIRLRRLASDAHLSLRDAIFSTSRVAKKLREPFEQGLLADWKEFLGAEGEILASDNAPHLLADVMPIYVRLHNRAVRAGVEKNKINK